MPSAPAPTNASPRSKRGKTSGTNASPSRVAGTNAPAASSSALPDQVLQKIKDFPSGPLFYPVLGGVTLGLVVLLAFKSRKKKLPAAEAATPEEPAKPAAKLPRSVVRKKAVHSCNIFYPNADARHLWLFDARGGGFALNREHTPAAGASLPAVVARSWSSLWQRKLNVAWLPPEQVFLRVAHLPASDFDETLSMVELQMEKLSPMPVAQVVWSLQVLPHAEPNMQTVLVTIAARSAVEEFLGKLEGQGFIADRLELPMLDQLQATTVNEDGAWIYPAGLGGHDTALVGWWSRGMLQNLALLTLPPADRPASLKEQLVQMAWAGEMEGWLSSPPTWHLVADSVTAEEWEPVLRQGLDQPIQVQPALPAPELAALTARRSAQAEPRSNLLPPEFAVRYHQQFVDRLWMRGLGVVIGLYLAGVGIYGVAVGVASVRTNSAEDEATQLEAKYNEAKQLRAKVGVLQERADLRYAALDCWLAVCQYLPEEAQLDALDFGNGRNLRLTGTAPPAQQQSLVTFARQLSEAKDQKGGDLFKKGAGIDARTLPGSATLNWSLTLELKRGELQ